MITKDKDNVKITYHIITVKGVATKVMCTQTAYHYCALCQTRNKSITTEYKEWSDADVLENDDIDLWHTISKKKTEERKRFKYIDDNNQWGKDTGYDYKIYDSETGDERK